METKIIKRKKKYLEEALAKAINFSATGNIIFYFLLFKNYGVEAAFGKYISMFGCDK